MKPVKIGIAGLGNVGEEVAYQLIKGFRVQKKMFLIELVAVSARSKSKKRKVDINHLKFFENPIDMVSDNKIDVIVELIGGDEGVAKDLCFSALKNNKAVITANKALIAKYGKELAEIAEERNLFFSFDNNQKYHQPRLMELLHFYTNYRDYYIYTIYYFLKFENQ